jgi:iron complex outermembrane receptor protein
LVISYVGVVTQRKQVTVAAGATTESNFEMINSGELNRVIVVGSRSTATRSSTQTPVPVDVITSRELMITGQVEPTQMLNFVAPSYNSSRQTIADGTDHVDPATIRGLGPDQTLVLVNGKRRYNTALMNVNGTIGRGSVGTDLNAIPAAAIEKVEVLRDGAASQYGSDAIAGVINIVTKKNATGTTLYSHWGKQYEGDGEVQQIGLNKGMNLGKKGGYFNISADIRHRDPTNRSGDYTGTVYTTNVPLDEQLIAQNIFSRKNNMHFGNSELYNYGGLVSMGFPFS